MSKGHQTQWTAQFLAASELVRRGYEVTFTMGNTTPVADLMVGSTRTGKLFWIDVKGLSSKNAWLLRRKPIRESLFYVLVLVGKKAGEDRFFIQTQSEANTLVQAYLDKHPNAKPLESFNWSDVLGFENRWDILPE